MPITRRRRAIPPEQQPEMNNHVDGQDVQNTLATPENSTVEQRPVEDVAASPIPPESAQPTSIPPLNAEHSERASAPQGTPILPGVNNEQQRTSPPEQFPPFQQNVPSRPERISRMERHDYPTAIESGRRTARGELFRRPPQHVAPQPAPAVSQPPLQPPSHEISLPLGNLLHLAYNPGYTGSDEARSTLLQQLADESKAGGRARCWNCGSLAIVYDRWNTRSKTFGEVGVAFCEICGVWSVM